MSETPPGFVDLPGTTPVSELAAYQHPPSPEVMAQLRRLLPPVRKPESDAEKAA